MTMDYGADADLIEQLLDTQTALIKHTKRLKRIIEERDDRITRMEEAKRDAEDITHP
jgi:hypothetical protein